MYVFDYIKTPARCDPFMEPRNTTEHIEVCSERLTIVFVGLDALARMWKLGPLNPPLSPDKGQREGWGWGTIQTGATTLRLVSQY